MTWYRSQLVAAVLVALFSSYSMIMEFTGNLNSLVSIQFAVNGFFIFPGLLLAFGVNQILLWRRRPHLVTTPERVILGILYGLIALTIVLSFIPEAIFFELPLWILLILTPITLTIVILVTSYSLRAEARAGSVQPAKSA